MIHHPFPRRRKSCPGIIDASFCACIKLGGLSPSYIQSGKKRYHPKVALKWRARPVRNQRQDYPVLLAHSTNKMKESCKSLIFCILWLVRVFPFPFLGLESICVLFWSTSLWTSKYTAIRSCNQTVLHDTPSGLSGRLSHDTVFSA